MFFASRANKRKRDSRIRDAIISKHETHFYIFFGGGVEG